MKIVLYKNRYAKYKYLNKNTFRCATPSRVHFQRGKYLSCNKIKQHYKGKGPYSYWIKKGDQEQSQNGGGDTQWDKYGKSQSCKDMTITDFIMVIIAQDFA